MVDTQYIIDTNILLLEQWNDVHPEDPQPIGVRRPEVDKIIPMVEEYDENHNTLKTFIKKASYLMAIVSWIQAFLDGNKRTGIVSAMKFLRDNGYDLDIPKDDEREIRSLLYDIQDQRTSLDHSVVAKIIIYTTERTKIHESR